MQALDVFIDGIGFWAPGLSGWDAAARALREGAAGDTATAAKPSPASLPPAERRRAPEPVLLAVEAAGQACAMAGRDPATLASVFVSTHGDLAITDAMCTTLADDPRELSPTRFHNSVHNAPAGYWTVATGCHASATAISAEQASFAAGLLEAAVEAHDGRDAVLLVAYDIAARGPLAEVARSTSPFAVAFVLSPERSERSLAGLRLQRRAQQSTSSNAASALDALTGNPTAAQALPLLASIARGDETDVVLHAGAGSTLTVGVMR